MEPDTAENDEQDVILTEKEIKVELTRSLLMRSRLETKRTPETNWGGSVSSRYICELDRITVQDYPVRASLKVLTIKNNEVAEYMVPIPTKDMSLLAFYVLMFTQETEKIKTQYASLF